MRSLLGAHEPAAHADGAAAAAEAAEQADDVPEMPDASREDVPVLEADEQPNPADGKGNNTEQTMFMMSSISTIIDGSAADGSDAAGGEVTAAAEDAAGVPAPVTAEGSAPVLSGDATEDTVAGSAAVAEVWHQCCQLLNHCLPGEYCDLTSLLTSRWLALHQCARKTM